MAIKTKDDLGILHSALADALLTRVESEDCSSADLAVAAKFLKDNDIIAKVGDDGGVGKLEEALNKSKRPRHSLTPADMEQALEQAQFNGSH